MDFQRKLHRRDGQRPALNSGTNPQEVWDKVQDRIKTLPGITDVQSDRDGAGLQLEVKVDRPLASKLGGIFVTELPDLDEAIRLAALVPTAEHGTLEIRPLTVR